jgi:protein gp37
MATKSSIEWTETTWNPVTGCTKVSAGCKHCYAERMAKRLQAMGVRQYRNGFKLTLAPHILDLPRRWREPRLVFVNSMSDLFHRDVPEEFILSVFRVMNETLRHTYQILTKRPERVLELSHRLNWTPNIWMGASVENEKVMERINLLRLCGASLKFLSLEPLLGPLPGLDLNEIDWVIVGGESGPGARQMKKEWVEEIQRSCREHATRFFFKQWGTIQSNPNQKDPTIASDAPDHAKGGCQLNGVVYREMPNNAAISRPSKIVSFPERGKKDRSYSPAPARSQHKKRHILNG